MECSVTSSVRFEIIKVNTPLSKSDCAIAAEELLAGKADHGDGAYIKILCESDR